MRLEWLDEFVAVVKQGSFNRAAKALFMSQSTLSAHMAGLERDLGFTLFDRDERGATLTAAGKVYLEYAQSIADACEEGRRAGLAASLRCPPVRVRANGASALFGECAAAGGEDLQYVEVDYGVGTVDALRRDLVDVALAADDRGTRESGTAPADPEACAGVSDDDLVRLSAGELACSVAVMRTHPLAGRPALARRDLDGQTVVIAGGAYFDEWSRVVQGILGPDVHVRFRMSPARSSADVAAEDFGGAVHLCGREANEDYYRHRGDVVLFDELDGEPLSWPAAVVYRADNPNPAVAAFAARLASRLAAGV